MSYVLLHINEFNYLLWSGSLRMHEHRVANIKPESDGVDIFRTAGYLKYSSPESYLLCRIELTRRPAPHDERDEVSFLVEMTDVQEIIPLTAQAEILLRPVIHRARLKVSEPRFEGAWSKFVDEEILRERRQAAIAFAQLFACEQINMVCWEPAPDLFLFMLKDLGSGLNEIERRSESAELGVFEFCVRLAHEHDAVWRRDDPKYAGLKEVRESELARKRHTAVSFLNSPRVCLALREFEEESFLRFGYSPFSLVAFFEFYRTHSRANGINFAQVKATLQLFMTYGRIQDASDYAHLVGYSLGLDEVTPATYFIQLTRFSVFDQAPSQYPRSEDLVVSMPSEVSNLFELPAKPQSPLASDGDESDPRTLEVADSLPEDAQGETGTDSDPQVPAEVADSDVEGASSSGPGEDMSSSAGSGPESSVDSIATAPAVQQSDAPPVVNVSVTSDASTPADSVVEAPDASSDPKRHWPGVSSGEERADVTQVPLLHQETQSEIPEILAAPSRDEGSEDSAPQIPKNAGRKGSKTKKKDLDVLPVSERP